MGSMQNNIGCILECAIFLITSVWRIPATNMLAMDVFDMVPQGVFEHSAGFWFFFLRESFEAVI